MDVHWDLNLYWIQFCFFISTNYPMLWYDCCEQPSLSGEQNFGSYKSVVLFIRSIRDSIIWMVSSTLLHIWFGSGLLIDLLFPCFRWPIVICWDKTFIYLMKRINNMQSEIIALLEMMNYMDNNIEILNKCNISANKHRGKKIRW